MIPDISCICIEDNQFEREWSNSQRYLIRRKSDCKVKACTNIDILTYLVKMKQYYIDKLFSVIIFEHFMESDNDYSNQFYEMEQTKALKFLNETFTTHECYLIKRTPTVRKYYLKPKSNSSLIIEKLK